MKNATLLLSVLVSAMLTSCAALSPTRMIGNTIGAASGGLIGSKLSKGDPLVTAASARAGVALSESLQARSNASANKSCDAGYNKGRSDSAKQQFLSLNEQQRLERKATTGQTFAPEVPLPEREENGVISYRAPQPLAFGSNSTLKLIVSLIALDRRALVCAQAS